MKPTQLLEHFDRLSEAPDAVRRLRRFILDLAVRGKLVVQDAGDEPAGELLKRIRAEKARLTTLGRIKAEKATESIDQTGWIVPGGWALCRWNTIALKIGDIDHKMPETVSGGVPYVSPRDFYPNNVIDFEGAKRISREDYLRLAAKIKPDLDDLIYPRYGTVGENRLVTEQREFLASYSCAVVKTLTGFIDPKYQYIFSISGYCKDQAKAAENKTTQANVGIASIQQYIVPLPPLAEQHRIVAKVDELMTLCDQLETAQQERERRRDRLASASLQRLNQPAADTNPETQREHARFHLHHLPRLTTRPEHVKAMRQTVRSLAICGRLVPQDARDGTASEFLLKVEEDRVRLAKAGEIGAAKPLESIAPDATPFPLPSGWEWARFGVLINHSDAGISPKTEGFSRSGDHWGVLKVSAVSWDRFKPEENKQLFEGLVPPDFAHVQAGDFLISRANTRELVAKCVIVDEKPVKLILSDKTVRLRLASLGNPRFWCLVNNHAEYARAYYANQASGTSDSMKNVSRPIIYNLLIPIPPLAEQHRIVAKVDALMALCAQLEAQLAVTQTDSRRLLEAVLDAALTPT